LDLAAYGHTYVLSDPSCATAGCAINDGASSGCAGATGFMPYFTIDKFILNERYDSVSYNPKSGTMELVVNSNKLISFDSPVTMQMKFNFASKACLRGTMRWAVYMKIQAILLGPD
jgi:chitinase